MGRKLDISALIPSEIAVLELLADGLTRDQTAERLGIKSGTLRKRVESAREKLEARSTVQAVEIWKQRRSAQ